MAAAISLRTTSWRTLYRRSSLATGQLFNNVQEGLVVVTEWAWAGWILPLLPKVRADVLLFLHVSLVLCGDRDVVE